MRTFVLKPEGQKVDDELYAELSPVPLEIMDGDLFFFAKEERENLLKLLIYNVGMNRTLEIIEEWKER